MPSAECIISILVKWGPFLGACATFLAVLVALFRESFLLWWRQPNLCIEIKPAPPDCNRGEIRDGGSVFHAYYLRLWVLNEGKTTASKVRILACALSRQHADGAFRSESRFLPMNLVWSHTLANFADGIPPKMGQHCDLGVIYQPDAAPPGIIRPSWIPPGKTCLEFATQVRPFNGTSHIEPGVYRLQLRVGADNCYPTDVTVEITLVGDWYESEAEMLSKGIGVRVQT